MEGLLDGEEVRSIGFVELDPRDEENSDALDVVADV
jgi:hypothetical protein